jgi:hypothetical protein
MRTAPLLLLAISLRAQSPCANTPAYSPCELAFDLPSTQLDPYKTVELKAEFRSPRHHTIGMPAFWDGGSHMIIRFAPTEAGDWAYRVTSNVQDFNGKTGNFTAAASESKGFIRPANTHHWAYTERDARGLDQAHLWMGATEMRFAFEDEAAFRAAADARAAQKFNHLRGSLIGEGGPAIYTSPDSPNAAFFTKLDERIRYLNTKGLTADLILAPDGAALTKLFPNWDQRRRFVRYLVARYAPGARSLPAPAHFGRARDVRAAAR